MVKGESHFIRADANASGAVNIADAVEIIRFLFSIEIVSCELAVDANDDNSLNIADAVWVLSYLFVGGSPPSQPFPDCGEDLDPGPLRCLSFSLCP